MTDNVVGYLAKIEPPLGSLKDYEERFFFDDPREQFDDDEVWDVRELVKRDEQQ